MHYKDGTLAKMGDIVRGRGHNLPYEVVGPVCDIHPDQTKCELSLQVMVSKYVPYFDDGDHAQSVPAHWDFEMFFEHGDAAQFTLIHREGWHQIPSMNLVWVQK